VVAFGLRQDQRAGNAAHQLGRSMRFISERVRLKARRSAEAERALRDRPRDPAAK